jgi:hypothetical protein
MCGFQCLVPLTAGGVLDIVARLVFEQVSRTALASGNILYLRRERPLLV